MTFSADSFLSDDVPWLKLVVSFSVIVYTLHTYLDVRQLRVSCQSPGISEQLKDTSTPHALCSWSRLGSLLGRQHHLHHC